MPDLDQIKQREQERGTGAGGYRRADRARPRGPFRRYQQPHARAGVIVASAQNGHLRVAVGAVPRGFARSAQTFLSTLSGQNLSP